MDIEGVLNITEIISHPFVKTKNLQLMLSETLLDRMLKVWGWYACRKKPVIHDLFYHFLNKI